MFGYNIEASQSHVPLEVIARSAAPFHVVMTAPNGGVTDSNALSQVDRYSAALGAERIVWRTYNPLEGDWTRYVNPATQVARWKAENRPAIIRDDPCNEPSISHNIAAYVARCVELLDRAADAGLRVAVGAFSVGTPHHEAIQRGEFDPLLQAIHRGNHYLSYHSYGHGIPDIGELRPITDLANPVQAAAGMIRQPWEIREGYWYLRRTDWFVMRARAIGLPDTPTIMTESVFDQINVAPGMMDGLRRAYGLPQYHNDLRGVLAWSKYWQAAGITLEELLQYLRDYVYAPAPYIKGVCLFAINANWRQPQGHDWGVLGNMLGVVIPQLNTKPRPTVPAPKPTTPAQKPPMPAQPSPSLLRQRLADIRAILDAIEVDL